MQILFFLFLLLATVAACATVNVIPAPKAQARLVLENPSHQVLRVVDGDTLVVSLDGKKTTIRLLGVDAPELSRWGKAEQPGAQKARRFLAKLVENEKVRLEFDRTWFDQFGRLLAYAHRERDGLFVNLEAVRTGHARAFVKYPFSRSAAFVAAEDNARKNRMGVWAAER